MLWLGVLAGGLLWADRGEAHKPMTSKYTYNEDVFPILRDRCGRCHVTGGVGPMSLLIYKEAYPWAESLRVELLAERMPPWHTFTLSARELDVILVWATGGTPQGSPANTPPVVTLKTEWSLGRPDLALQMPSEFVFAADKMEDVQEFVLPTGTANDRWIKAVDLLPGTPAIVRDAFIYLKPASRRGTSARGGGASGSRNTGSGSPENVLGAWIPGQDPAPAAEGVAFRLPAGAEIVVRVHYKKTWKYEGTAMTDRSIVGLYFRDPPTAPVRPARRRR